MIEHFVALLEKDPEQVLQLDEFGAAIRIDRCILNFTMRAKFNIARLQKPLLPSQALRCDTAFENSPDGIKAAVACLIERLAFFQYCEATRHEGDFFGNPMAPHAVRIETAQSLHVPRTSSRIRPGFRSFAG